MERTRPDRTRTTSLPRRVVRRIWAPLRKAVVGELRAYAALGRWIARRPDVPPGARGFGYSKGSLAFPMTMVVLSALELAIVHLLVPWPGVRGAAAVLTVWGVLFVLGLLATRIVHPHLVSESALQLRWGHRIVLTAAPDEIARVERHADHRHTQPAILNDDTLVLTTFRSVNVRVVFTRPISADAPLWGGDRRPGFHARQVWLALDEPDAFIHEVRSRLLPADTLP